MPTVTPRTDVVVIEPVLGRRHTVRKWIATAALSLAVLTPVFFMVAAVGTRLGLWSLRTGFGTLSRNLGPKLMILTLVVGIVALLLGLFLKPRRKRAITAGAVAIVVPLIGMIYGQSVAAKADRLPFIHDVTTDTQDPPVFAGKILAERAKVERVNTLDYVGKRDTREEKLVSVLQARDYADIRPVISEDSPEVAFARAKDVAEDMGWAIKDSDPDAGTIEATATTFWYGFKDDVAIRIRPGTGGGSVVDVRSVSRVGGSDLGANADRIRDFVDAFKR